jgi:hypothetical protein
VVPLLPAKTSRVIPPVSAAIPAHVSSARNAEGVIAAAAAAQTAGAVVPIVVQTAGAQAARDSNAVLAAQEVRGTIVVTAAIPVRRAVRNSSAKC